MALIKKAKGRKEGSGYVRLFGDDGLGLLVSRAHSAVISSGSELEKLVKNQVQLIPNLDEFLAREIMPDGVLVADKKNMKKCKTLDFAGSEPDFMIFKRRQGSQNCHIVELKDGDSFDTKKAAAERRAMHDFISKNGRHIRYTVDAHFCCFNQNNKKAIYDGFKRKIALAEAMTGREFCELLELDYDAIVRQRTADADANLRYFLSELAKIDSVKRHFGID